jgi:2-succinyl-5-enolpyruvyl-6-hydroxy-3-cyclohexene-1-carboxylate synthase
MSWIRAFLELNKSLFLKGLLLLMAFLLGLQMGQSRLQRQWDAEKQTVQIAQAKQEQHVADVARVQNQISKEISDDYRKKSSFLASRSVPIRMLDNSAANSKSLLFVPSGSTRVDGDSSNDIPSASGSERETVGCTKIVEDAEKTTLMLIEFQRWYNKQHLLMH